MAVMHVQRDSLEARKAWFFVDGGMWALGAGIRASGPGVVHTSISQTWKRGPVQNAHGHDIPVVQHDGIRYVFPKGGDIHVESQRRQGNWNDINQSYDENVEGEVFSLWLEHGVAPTDAAYVYGVLLEDIAEDASILANTETLQAIELTGSGLLMAAFLVAGKVTSGDGLQIDVDQPCLLLAQRQRETLTLTLANHNNQALSVRGRVNGGTWIDFDLPGAGAADISVRRTTTIRTG